MVTEIRLSEEIQMVLKDLRGGIRSFDYDVGKDIISLYCKLEEQEVSWAAIRLVKYHASSGTIKLLLRRFNQDVTTVRITADNEVRVTRQGTWVSARSPKEATEILVDHLSDLRKRVATANRHGIRIFDNRTFRRGRGNREFTPRVKED
jgi:hypothetical protein